MTITTEYRSYAPDLEVRAAGQGGDGRTVEGIVVPYGRAQRIDATLIEQFAAGAFRSQLAKAWRVRFTRDHLAHGGAIIGKAVELREDARGLWGAFRVSATAAGDETLELVKDGALDEMSIGFRTGPRGSRTLENGVVERISAHLIEVSMVAEGAYGQLAKVAAVRSIEGADLDDLDAARPLAERARALRAAIPRDPTRDPVRCLFG